MNTRHTKAWCRRFKVWATSAGLLMLWSSCPFVMAQQASQEIAETQSRFLRTVSDLQGASPESRVEFATAALTNLAAAYAAEAKLARAEASGPNRDASLQGWSGAVDGYARQLPGLLGDIQRGLPVGLLVVEKSVAVTVADQVVILNHPRLSQQSVFEQGILTDFCGRYRCENFVAEGSESQPIPVSIGQVSPDWNFTQQRWFCSYRGISVRFSVEANLTNSRLICEQFIQEIIVLADDIALQHRNDVPIDWDGLVIQSTPNRPGHTVLLNAQGDASLVTVPLLYGSPSLLAQITPWIRQHLTHQKVDDIELDAQRYGWQKP